MHMLSRKDLNSSELENVRVSESPTTVVAANGEVQINVEATVYVKDFDSFVTVTLLEDAPAVLKLGKRCEDHGYSYEWTSGQIHNSLKMEGNTTLHGKLRTDRCPWFIDRFFQLN